ncbi:hypothetical protein GCM10010431_57210 [Streptomyces kunmingensis]
MLVTMKVSATVMDWTSWLCVADRLTVLSPQRSAPGARCGKIALQGTVPVRTVPELSPLEDVGPPAARSSTCMSGSVGGR